MEPTIKKIKTIKPKKMPDPYMIRPHLLESFIEITPEICVLCLPAGRQGQGRKASAKARKIVSM
jgi:hypothetical protein